MGMRKLCVVLGVVLALISCTGFALADEADITVNGTGTVLVESDLAIITLGVREIAREVLDAQGAVNEKIAAVRQALVDAGVQTDEINTDNINIYANYDYSGSGESIVGYTAYNSLSVHTTDIDAVGALIDAAFAAGANSLDNVQFTVQDDTDARDEALKKAVEDALRRGKVLAQAAGLTISSISDITESYNYSYDSGMNYRYAAEDTPGAGTSVQAALVNVSASVTMTFEAK